MARNTAEAARLGREGHGMSGQYEEILGYPCMRLSAPLYKVSAAEGQAREVASYFCGTLLSNLRTWKKCHEARLTSLNIYTLSI